jgi:hypothetical protein
MKQDCIIVIQFGRQAGPLAAPITIVAAGHRTANTNAKSEGGKRRPLKIEPTDVGGAG